MLDLPRSVRLALWLRAAIEGRATVRDVLRAVRGDDEPHTIDSGEWPDWADQVQRADDDAPAGSATDLGSGGSQDLGRALQWLLPRAAGVQVVLPVPGDVVGLRGPGEMSTAAMDAGECVFVDLSPDALGEVTGSVASSVDAVGLVPEVTEFGSWLEPGAMVTWRAWPVRAQRAPLGDMGSLAEADRILREALREATEALADMDVSRWRDDASDRITAIRDGGLDRRAAPASTPPRALRVLASASRIRAIVDLAMQDDGAAIVGWQASVRRATLRDVGEVARRAMVAATNAPR
ncbi:MAG TPA: hypothetical protein VFX33_00630 [Actinomycetales bacterium]|nr:hypothetical protein [Actinomycetales bacterium]